MHETLRRADTIPDQRATDYTVFDTRPARRPQPGSRSWPDPTNPCEIPPFAFESPFHEQQ